MASTRTINTLGVVATFALGACGSDSITAPSAGGDAVDNVVWHAQPASDHAPSGRWNAMARDLVALRKVDPPGASRIYALLSVAQYQAVGDADRAFAGSSRSRHESTTRASVIAASASVLASAFMLDADRVHQAEAADMAQLGANSSGDLSHATAVGEGAAQRVLREASSDRSDAPWTGLIPAGPGLWFSAAGASALRPAWGSVRPWLLRSGSDLRPPPPPAWGSAEYAAALAEVRRISDTRTAEQLRIALFWSDGAGTATPPGHWNAIAADLIEQHHLDEAQATRVFALLNMALMDAGIACWDAKYHYWLIRPSQADPGIVTAVPLPNFPSYVSGHATFSGAASELLGAAFPSDRRKLTAMAEEAAASRLYGGIHYRFDNERGLALGRSIGRMAAARLHEPTSQ